MFWFLLEEESGLVLMAWFSFNVWDIGKRALWLPIYPFTDYPWVRRWVKNLIKANIVVEAWRQEVMMPGVSWMSAIGRRLKWRWLKNFARMTKILKKVYLENLSHCVFKSNQCFAVRTALRKYKCNIEFSTKTHVQHPVKSVFLLFGCWRKTLLTLCILVWRGYEAGQLSLKQNLAQEYEHTMITE